MIILIYLESLIFERSLQEKKREEEEEKNKRKDMDEIKNDADALGASLMAPFMIIVGIVSASLIIYCIVTCVKNRRK